MTEKVVISTDCDGKSLLKRYIGKQLTSIEPADDEKYETRLWFDDLPEEANEKRKPFFTEEEESELIEAIQEYAETDEIRHFDEVAKSIVMRLAANAIGYWRESQ